MRPGSRAASEVTSRGQRSMKGQERQGTTVAMLPSSPTRREVYIYLTPPGVSSKSFRASSQCWDTRGPGPTQLVLSRDARWGML